MYRKILFLTLLASASQSEASDNGVCKAISEIASVVMQARQIGVPMADLMDVFHKDDYKESEINLIKKMVINAYEQPKFSTTKVQGETITEFSNQWHLSCVKNNQRGGK
jgi:hypothetical protein